MTTRPRTTAASDSRIAPSGTDLGAKAAERVTESLRPLLADVFALYIKTKNFHWHIGGPNFRDYHLMLDEHADQLFAMTDAIAERARKLGGTTIRSIGDISRHQRLEDNDERDLSAEAMLEELRDDNRRLAGLLREAHEVCDSQKDSATTSLIEVWIDETERRGWFLTQIVG